MKIENYQEGRKFNVRGAIYKRCSGVITKLEFSFPVCGGLDEREFPVKGQSIGKLKMFLEEMWTGILDDPIKCRGCLAIKIHYIDEPETKTHWI